MASEEPAVPAGSMVWETMRVGRPAGTHLSQAGGTGGYSALARDDDTNELRTHATLLPVDDEDEDAAGAYAYWPPTGPLHLDDAAEAEEEYSTLGEFLGILVVAGGLYAAGKLAPHVSRWWNDSAFPALRSAWYWLPGTGDGSSSTIRYEPATAIEAAAPSSDVVVALDQYRTVMSSAEARDRLFVALAARLVSDAQLSVLRGARIEDVDGSPELEQAVAALTPEQVGASMALMLETHPSLAPDDLTADLRRILAGNAVDSGRALSGDAQPEKPLRLSAGGA
jgi:hypothetical protein